LLLNCGGQLDLTKTCIGEKEKVNCFLLDSHRPIHHNNLGDKKNIKVCLDLEQERIDELPSVQDIQFYEQFKHDMDLDADEEDDLSDDAEEESDDLEEDDEESKQEDARSKCSGEELLGDDEEPELGKKRAYKESKASKVEKRFKRQKRTVGNRLRAYYEGAYFGISASMLAYHIAKSMNRENKDILWNAILGVTDQIIHDKRTPMELEKDLYEVTSE